MQGPWSYRRTTRRETYVSRRQLQKFHFPIGRKTSSIFTKCKKGFGVILVERICACCTFVLTAVLFFTFPCKIPLCSEEVEKLRCNNASQARSIAACGSAHLRPPLVDYGGRVTLLLFILLHHCLLFVGRYRSGQTDLAVNQVSLTSGVRIPPGPPEFLNRINHLRIHKQYPRRP